MLYDNTRRKSKDPKRQNKKNNPMVNKNIITLVLCIVATTYLLGSAFNYILKEACAKENKFKKHIGKKIVIDKDTLTIIDYSTLYENFTLSDGGKVNN